MIAESNQGMQPEVKLWFRDRLREAREAAMRDAEGCDGIILVLERMGMVLTQKHGRLDGYALEICKQAECSPLALDCGDINTPFRELYEFVQRGRNKAYHEGAYGRHLTTHAVILSTILEHSLMQDATVVRDLMVQQPVCALTWQPISFIRQIMLVNSFSFLPVLVGSVTENRVWQLVSSQSVARYIRASENGAEIKKRLVTPLERAVDEGLSLSQANTCLPSDLLTKVLNRVDEKPTLVLHGQTNDLIGVLTSFDLL